MSPYYRCITVLLNPRAGKNGAASAAEVAEAFRAAGCEADIRVTEGAAVVDAVEQALQRGSTRIVAAGGDGTVSAVASVVARRNAVLGVLPLGTLNHFAKDLGIPMDVPKAIEVIAAARTSAVDVGDVNGRLFVNHVSIGLYASLVSERAAMQRTGRRKWLAHVLAAMRVWRQYRHHRVAIDVNGRRRTVRTPFVFIGNNEYQLSGLELGGRKTLLAGRLHLCMAPGMTRLGVARLIVTAIFGDVSALDSFESLTTHAVAFDGGIPRVQASVDGELIVLENPLTCHIRPGALRVMVP